MRTVARRLTLPTTALMAALALTACQSDGSKAAADPAPVASATNASPHTSAPAEQPSTTASPRPTASKQAAKPDAKAPRTTGNPAPKPTAKPHEPSSGTPVTATCTAAHTKIVASRVSRPINHLVLTVTNVGSRPCNALNAPFVGFDDPQAAIRVLEESKPQAVVTLMPGESGYASLPLTGEPGPDTHGRTVRTIKVNLTRDSGTTVTAPAGTFADDGAAVSYWQRTLEEALTY
ncbi:DUF4232 domain-containing protein [Streptomyces showdoensis]|uniref:DUF4232 domain-containing protein n=1 Tax=Streptomyces showdoensis TaxID=68268 RepID=A0A2P2GIT0_STREW|nr:DUF4232 domain-containing protein [Streptomyces showdoensis]KKZ71422.1 hypothetical protein VO63_23860 [Streptomyces showdoensis]